MTTYIRPCSCQHGFPLCACCEGLIGGALLERSRWLSSVAGYPAVVGVTAAVATITAHCVPVPDPATDSLTPRDCGCGGRA